MANAVFTTRVEPSYDDQPEVRYHFPRTYLRQVEAAVGDWIVYYEPRRTSSDPGSRGGRQAYFATARVTAIVPDANRPDHFYALIADYLEFEAPVPFRTGAAYAESALRRADGGTSRGAFGRAVRQLPVSEYEAIVRAGLAPVLRSDPASTAETLAGDLFADPGAPFARPIVEQLVRRPFRDRAFAAAVATAYDRTCAVTRLRLINGGGRAEVQAAHIRPVAADGPDTVRNGLALSGTVHWMFDRGMLSVDEDLSILIAADRVPAPMLGLIAADRRLKVPARPELHPHPSYLAWHRNHVFKG